MARIISNARVTLNNEPLPIVPNSLMIDEGLGEQSLMSASLGGREIEDIYSEDIEDNYGCVKFSVYATRDVIERIKLAKTNANLNTVEVSASNSDGSFTRVLAKAALLTKYEIPLAKEGSFEVEFKGRPLL